MLFLPNPACVSLLAEPDQLIIDSRTSPSDNLISLSYSMPAFSANLFGLIFPNIPIFELSTFPPFFKPSTDFFCMQFCAYKLHSKLDMITPKNRFSNLG